MMGRWKALAGRISIIAGTPVVSGSVSVLELYKQAWGMDPLSFQQAPNPLAPSLAQGVRSGMTSSCNLAPNRVDFNLTPHSNSEMETEPTLVLMEDAGALHGELLRLSVALGVGAVNLPEEFNRVAIAVQFASIEANATEANRTITQAIPEKYRPKLNDEQAFVFQINQPARISPVEATQVNFVTKWSVEQFQVFRLGVSSDSMQGGSGQGALQPQWKTFVGACISFECNLLPLSNLIKFSRNEQAKVLIQGLNLISQSQQEYGLHMEGFVNAPITH